MTKEDFEQLVLTEHEESCSILSRKATEYAGKEDRLLNFKQAAGLRSINSVEAAMGMLTKHFVSVSDMAKNPIKYPIEQWDEKLRDIRNYTYLIKGLLIDMGAI